MEDKTGNEKPYKIFPREELEQLVLNLIEKNRIYAEYGKDEEGIFQVNFLVTEDEPED